MKYTTTFITTFFLAAFVYSQSTVDSLRTVIDSKGSSNDQINASLKLLEAFQLKNFDTTLMEGDKALQLARKNTDSVSVAEIKRHIGVASYFKGKYDVAAKNFYESIAILEKANEKKKLAPVYNELARALARDPGGDPAGQDRAERQGAAADGAGGGLGRAAALPRELTPRGLARDGRAIARQTC